MIVKSRRWWLLALAPIACLYLGSVAAQPPPNPDSEAQPAAPTRGSHYPRGRTHGPLTEAVVARMREIWTRGAHHRPHSFVKVGASATRARPYLRCFAGEQVDLSAHQELSETLAFFRGGPGPNPFSRRSLATGAGWHAGRLLRGPPVLAREVRALDPGFAVVMFGTNDIQHGRPHQYARDMSNVVRILTVRGVVPILSTFMPRDDSAAADRWVPLYNEIVRSIAAANQIGFVDFHRELVALPGHGMARDGIHPNVEFIEGRSRGCDFSPAGLQHGYNVRNLLTLQSLHRLRSALVLHRSPPDRETPFPSGRGTLERPFEITSLPYSHAGDNSAVSHAIVDRYSGCSRARALGPEVFYRLRLSTRADVYALVTPESRYDDLDIYLLRRAGEGLACLASGDRSVRRELEAGDYLIAIDSPRARGADGPGAYQLVLARVDRGSDAAMAP